METLVFDLDGTLVDSLADLAAALATTLQARGLAPLTPAQIRPLVGDGLGVLVSRAFELRGAVADASALAEIMAEYDAHPAARSVLFAGAADALRAAAAAGLCVCVCTNKPERPARALLAALGVEHAFGAICGGDSFDVRKPDPGHLLMTLARVGGTADRAVMVGDHHNDIAAARGAGVASIYAPWGYGQPGVANDADAVCHDLCDVVPTAIALLARREIR